VCKHAVPPTTPGEHVPTRRPTCYCVSVEGAEMSKDVAAAAGDTGIFSAKGDAPAVGCPVP